MRNVDTSARGLSFILDCNLQFYVAQSIVLFIERFHFTTSTSFFTTSTRIQRKVSPINCTATWGATYWCLKYCVRYYVLWNHQQLVFLVGFSFHLLEVNLLACWPNKKVISNPPEILSITTTNVLNYLKTFFPNELLTRLGYNPQLWRFS